VALVIVLACLVLLAALVIGFFTQVSTELKSAKSYAEGSNARLLADSALNLAIGQLQLATGSASDAWASQPGLIRTFDTSGKPVAAYKLYSSDQLIVNGPFDPVTDLPPAKWAEQPNLFTDLNAPIMRDGIRTFPIIDANALTPAGILDADADGKPDVEGFAVTDKTFMGSDPAQPPTLAMPVRWLYQLRDGSLARAASAGAGTKVKLTKLDGGAVTADNPPVARIAYWADDETCKVNLNTASEGTLWDTPVCNTLAKTPAAPDPDKIYEHDLADMQPARNEYQRYPGHPATTSLSPILYAPLQQALAAKGSPTARSDVLEAIYALAPRVTGGASSSLGGLQRGKAALTPDDDRLFASLDEFIYQPTPTGGQRVESDLLAAGSRKRKEMIERARFFLTANSRAPEINAWNKPRAAAWPVHQSATKRTAFDKLIAFCGTTGHGTDQRPFYFQRSNPLSGTEDFAIPRNLELYNYLERLTKTTAPGIGRGSLATKNGADNPQILTELADYIRCLNLQDVTAGAGGAYTDVTDNAIRGEVLPLIHPTNGTKGFGRIATISELAISIVGFRSTGEPGSGRTSTDIQVLIAPELFSPMAGYSAMATNLKLTFEGLKTLKINGSPVPFPSDSHEMFTNRYPSDHGQSRYGGYMGVGGLLKTSKGPNTPTPFNVSGSNEGNDPGKPDNKLTINAGAKIVCKIEAPYDRGTPSLVQRFEFRITKDIVVRVPKRYSGAGVDAVDTRYAQVNGANYHDYIRSGNDTVVSLVPMGGTVDAQADFRLVAAAGPADDAGKYFGIHPDALSADLATASMAHTLRPGYSQPYNGAKFGALVAGVNKYDSPSHSFNWTISPDLPRSVDGVKNSLGQPGDWDNGPGIQGDGPLINKADEGSTQSVGGGKVPYIGDNYQMNISSNVSPTVFSPNRQMPSPVMFGSLPTGVKRGRPWQTLLFRPARSYLPGGTAHPGAASSTAPPDHLWLDLFWNPVVEPYAISEPFSTAGKINLNAQLAPFTYIRRDTGLRAAMKAVKIIALNPDLPSPDDPSRTFVNRYKMGSGEGGTSNGTGAFDNSIRYDIDADATLARVHARLAGKLPGGDPDAANNGKPFITASEICDVPLVPKGIATGSTSIAAIEAALATFWAKNKLTGDNSLERPYAHLYPRLTTRSNTFTLHVRAQVLQKTQRLAPDEFDDATDRVAGEFRGSFILERYLDPNTQSFDDTAAGTALGPYKCRVVTSKQFTR